MKTETLEPVETTAAYKTASPAKDGAATLSAPIIQLKNILVPLDFSETSLKSLEYAVPFAKLFGAKITLLHVAEPPAFTSEFSHPLGLGPELAARIENQLEHIRKTMIPSDVEVDTALRYNFVFDNIVEVARDICADLIITTTHGHTGLMHMFLGSTAENIVRRAPCPVLVVRESEHDFVAPKAEIESVQI